MEYLFWYDKSCSWGWIETLQYRLVSFILWVSSASYVKSHAFFLYNKFHKLLGLVWINMQYVKRITVSVPQRKDCFRYSDWSQHICTKMVNLLRKLVLIFQSILLLLALILTIVLGVLLALISTYSNHWHRCSHGFNINHWHRWQKNQKIIVSSHDSNWFIGCCKMHFKSKV